MLNACIEHGTDVKGPPVTTGSRARDELEDPVCVGTGLRSWYDLHADADLALVDPWDAVPEGADLLDLVASPANG